MRKLALTLGLLLGLSTLAPRPAAALSCVHPSDQLPGLALIVQGRVEKVAPRLRLPTWSGPPSQPEDITLTVSRYFKGDGPAKLDAVFDGIGWETMNPVGSEVIMGFHLDESGNYRSGACTLRLNALPTNAFETEMLVLVRSRYGEGRAPTGGEPAPAAVPRGQWLLWAGMGALGALTAGLWLRRRGKRSK